MAGKRTSITKLPPLVKEDVFHMKTRIQEVKNLIKN